MPTIIESICYGNSRYKAAQVLTPRGVVLHSIGCPQPKASVLVDSWQRNKSPYVVHYMVDDKEIHQTMPESLRCWHVGSPGNSKWLGIEMGEPKQLKYTSGSTFTVSDLAAAQAYTEACYKNAVWLIAQLCKKYKWDPYTAVLTHYEISTKGLSMTDHVDPEHLWNGLGMGYDLYTLRRDVAKAMNETTKTEAAPQKSPAASTKTETTGGVCSVDLPVLKKGNKGASVKALQLLLIGNGRSCGSCGADGDFGGGTHGAVVAFQTKKGLTVDGIVGAKTWAALLK